MAKLHVTDTEQGNQVPFLRGILIRSLQDAGLPFEEAHRLASSIREHLSATRSGKEGEGPPTVTTRILRAAVLRQLKQSRYAEALKRYRADSASTPQILVEYDNGQRVPFSRGYHQRRLEACAITTEEAVILTQTVYAHLIDRGEHTIRAAHLDSMTYASLKHEIGSAVAKRYLVWTDFVHSGRPLVLLIGGTAGSGKSTTATDIANRLEIVRTQSTDMLREVMRLMIPQRLLPVLHTSSFEAWKCLPGVDATGRCTDEQLADGFHAQAELLSVACEGVVQRALRERVSLILEGVHAHPGFLDKSGLSLEHDSLVVPIMLAVPDRNELRKRIRGRGAETPQRRAARYLEHFDAIWRLQKVLLSDADRSRVNIIENTSTDKVFREVMRHVINVLAKDFKKTPNQVFGERVRAAYFRGRAHRASAP